MDLTRPRGYSFPQCEPPIIEDASDIIQMANLALTIDADIQTQFNQVDNNLLTPDGVHLAATVSQTIQQGDTIVYNTSRFDNTPGAAMSFTGGPVIISDGTYLVTGWVRVDEGLTPPLDNLKMLLSIRGVGTIATLGLATNFNTTTLPGCVNGSAVVRLNAGQQLQLSVATSGTVTLTVEVSEFSAVRMGPL